MKLRKECPHGLYDAHDYRKRGVNYRCRGGEFLPDDALEQIELDAYARGVNWRAFDTGYPIAVEHNGVSGWWIPPFDALTVREGAG